MFREYPVGPPTIITYNFKDIKEYFGKNTATGWLAGWLRVQYPMAWCNGSISGICQLTILPPAGLFMPVLPMRTTKGKLVFGLCATCAEVQTESPYCNHTERERAITHGVYCTPEIVRALEFGYQIVDVDTVWHWEKRSDQLFREFLLKWMRMKIVNSGFPPTCRSEQERRTYLDTQNEFYGLDIQMEEVQKNQTMRTLAKFNLNSFWGRFGMQSNKLITELLKTTEAYLKLVTNKNKEVREMIPVSDEMLMAGYSYADGVAPITGNLSLTIALFTTCWARLHLYDEALSKLAPWQILYYDTDSVIYIEKQGLPTLERGEMVGEFKDEIADEYGPDAKMTKFFSSGPKSYGYSVQLPDGSERVRCKVKGIPLNSGVQKQFGPKEMLEAIEAMDGRKLNIHLPWRIVRDKKKGELRNRPETKSWQVVCDKRVLIKDGSYSTLPYGYYQNGLNCDF